MTSNVAEIIRRMNARKGAVERELGQAARRIALEVGGESKKILQEEIYNQPVATRPRSGKPKWRRTGNLKRQETARAQGVNVILANRTKYAVPRYTLGTGESKRKIVSPGVRSVQWQREALAKKRPVVLKLRREAVLKALRSP